MQFCSLHLSCRLGAPRGAVIIVSLACPWGLSLIGAHERDFHVACKLVLLPPSSRPLLLTRADTVEADHLPQLPLPLHRINPQAGTAISIGLVTPRCWWSTIFSGILIKEKPLCCVCTNRRKHTSHCWATFCHMGTEQRWQVLHPDPFSSSLVHSCS